jgi:hypothetical protein
MYDLDIERLRDLQIEFAREIMRLSGRLEAIKLEVDLRDKSHEIARIASEKEYARRLDALNNESGRLHSMQMTYLPREIYELAQTKLLERVDNLDKQAANQLGRQAVLSVVVTTLITLGVFALHILFT